MVAVCHFLLFLLSFVVVCCEVGRVADQSSRVCFPSTLAPTFSLHCIILRGIIIVLALFAFCHILLSDIKIGGLRRFLKIQPCSSPSFTHMRIIQGVFRCASISWIHVGESVSE